MSWTKIMPFAAALMVFAACQETPDPLEPGTPADPAGNAVLLDVPEDHPGNPFYSPIQIIPGVSSLFPHTEEWGAAPFERDLSCVPSDFNLLRLFDLTPAFPGGPPRVFLCALTVEGFNAWLNGPGIDRGPLMGQSRGLGAVPVVFAHWDEIEAALEDEMLTLPELLALPSAVVGTADHYVADYVNGPLPLGFVMHKITSHGTLPDGRSFEVHVNNTCRGLPSIECPGSEGEIRYQIDIR